MKCVSIISLVFLFCCRNTETPFEVLECNDGPNIENKNLRKVFKPCRQLIYQAKYWDANHAMISTEDIWMMAVGEGTLYDPARLDRIATQYRFTEEDETRIGPLNLNRTRMIPWKTKMNNNAFETETECWMQPFRENQYNFTQIAPYPSVVLPLGYDLAWVSKLEVYDGWGDWSGMILENKYEVIDYVAVETEYGVIKGTWHVYAFNESDLGVNTLNFWFHEDLGFVKMQYKNYAGQLLIFELKEVIE